MLLLKEEGKGLLVEGGLLDHLGEPDGHLVDGADDSEVVVRVVEGPQDPVEDVLKLQSLPPAGSRGKEGEEEGMGHDLSQGRRHPQACCETDLDLPAYSGGVQTGIPG